MACITADRNAKMGCVYETKQQISRGYELALRELSAEYSAELLQHSLSNRIVYNPPGLMEIRLQKWRIKTSAWKDLVSQFSWKEKRKEV